MEPFQILTPDGTVKNRDALIQSGVTMDECIMIYEKMLGVRFMSIYGDEEGRTDRMTLFIYPLGEEAAVASTLSLANEDRVKTYGRYWDIAYARGVEKQSVFDLFTDNPSLEAVKDFFSHGTDLPYVSVGTQFLYTVGDAMARKIRKEKGIGVVHVGDGATAQGYYHSALNWASIYKVPVVFVCRNNRRAISTPNELTSATGMFAERAVAYGIKYNVADGNDPFAVYSAAKDAYRYVREEGLAFFLELRGARRMGPHTTAVAEIVPLTNEETAEIIEKDPLRRFRRFLFSEDARALLNLHWDIEQDFALIARIAGRKLHGLLDSQHFTKTIPMAWLKNALSEELLVQLKANVELTGPGEVKAAMTQSSEAAEKALQEGAALLEEMVRLNTEPRFDERYFTRRVSFTPAEIANATPREAIGIALHDILLLDKDSVLAGEDIGKIGGVLRTTAISGRIIDEHFPALKERVLQNALPLQVIFPGRIFDTPLDESGIVGIFGKGAAMAGLRPKVEVQFSGFSVIAFDQIVELAKTIQRSGGLIDAPCVVRLPFGGGKRIDYHQSCEIAYFANIPGIVIACPSTVQDFYDMLFAASACNRPVLFFENLQLQFERSEDARATLLRRSPWQPLETFGIRVAEEAVVQDPYKGGVTVAACGLMVYEALGAARLVGEGRPDIPIEILDIRIISPFPKEALIASVAKTGRLVTVQEEPKCFGTGAELSACVAETKESFDLLRAPIARVAPPQAFHPFQTKHWKFYVPNREKIAKAIIETFDFGT